MARTRKSSQLQNIARLQQDRKRREDKQRLRRLLKDQREILALTRQLLRAQAASDAGLESLRVHLNERDADRFAAAAAREGRHGQDASLRQDVPQRETQSV